MKFHKQLNKHDPENGVFGDCYRTAIACILDKYPSEVIHVYDLDDLSLQNEKMKEYLDGLGLRLLHTAYRFKTFKNALKIGEYNIGEMYWILSGASSRGVNHSIVCYKDEAIHDPHPSDDFLCAPCDDGYWHVEIIVRPL